MLGTISKGATLIESINQSLAKEQPIMIQESRQTIKSRIRGLYYRSYNRIAEPIYRVVVEITTRQYNAQLRYRAEGFSGLQSQVQLSLHCINEYNESITRSNVKIRLLAGLFAEEARFIILDSCADYWKRIQAIDNLKSIA